MRRTQDGRPLDWHLLNYFESPRYRVLFPVAYGVGEDGARHYGFVPPFYLVQNPMLLFATFFKGPDYWFVPWALSGGWRQKDGSDTVWITPLFHRTLEPDGSRRSMHFLNYLEGPGYKVFAPFYWNWRQGDAERTVVPPVYWEVRRPGGRLEASALLGLVHYRRGDTLNVPQEEAPLAYAHPFLYLQAGDDYDFRFLWGLFRTRRQGESTFYQGLGGLLWRLERPRPGVPARGGVLGNFFQRTVDYNKGTYTNRIFWVIPVRKGTFTPR
jgi:hypothetical protein